MREAVSDLNKNEQAKIMVFPNSVEAGKALKKFLTKDDLILIKGSQGIRMERAVELVMEEPQKAEKLLCRQSREWKRK